MRISHRIRNDCDLELVHDNAGDLPRDLPALPSPRAFCWVELQNFFTGPDEAHTDHRSPESDNPKFWAVWFDEALKEAEQAVSITREVEVIEQVSANDAGNEYGE